MQKYTNFIIIWKLYDFFIFASDTLFSDFILSDGCMFSYLTCIQLEPVGSVCESDSFRAVKNEICHTGLHIGQHHKGVDKEDLFLNDELKRLSRS